MTTNDSITQVGTSAPREMGLSEKRSAVQVEAERARNQLMMSLIPPMGRRAVSVFLGREDYRKNEQTVSRTKAHLLMEALPAFVAEGAGQVVTTMRFETEPRESIENAVESSATVSGCARQFVINGSVFAYFEEERVVVSVEPEWDPEGYVSKIVTSSCHDSEAFFRRWEAFARQHNFLQGQAFFADGELIERNRACTWDDILLPKEIERTIRLHVEGFLNNSKRLQALGVKGRRGIILEGPPGTGKTLLGKVLADTLDCSFIWVTPRHIGSGQSFHRVLSLARFVSPTVVFLEDIDLFAEERRSKSSMELGELMNQLDGAIDNEGIITIATTNHLDVVEKALRNRPGRFDRVLHIGEMDEPCRGKFLSRLLAKAVVMPEDVKYLVRGTDGYTGAQIEELTNTLYIFALDGHNHGDTVSGNGRVVIDRKMIDFALSDVTVERKRAAGFGA